MSELRLAGVAHIGDEVHLYLLADTLDVTGVRLTIAEARDYGQRLLEAAADAARMASS